jgi:acyl dehydratase
MMQVTSAEVSVAEPDGHGGADRLYLDDLHVGQRFTSGVHALDTAQIKAFAGQFDPQPFHLDEEAAKDSIFGGLAASGWFTACLWMRAYADEVLLRSTGQGSPGGTQFAWLRPLFPGDVVRATAEVLTARPSRSRPGLGIVEMRAELLRAEELLFRCDFTGMFLMRT